jgi:hypothetical protein
MIATRDGGGHDVKAGRMYLRRLEAKQAKNVAELPNCERPGSYSLNEMSFRSFSVLAKGFCQLVFAGRHAKYQLYLHMACCHNFH